MSPSRVDEVTLHERVLQRDPVAPVEVFQTYMPWLLRALRKTCEREDAYDSAIDAVFVYLQHPERYDPQRSRLFTYLRQIAQKRGVDRHRSHAARARREQGFAGIVELQATAPNEELERGMEAALVLERLEKYDITQRDRAALRLILQGERSTRELAKALGLESSSEVEMRREVKRHRDRLMKLLERLGKEDSDDES
ncbi:RNA polymerase sigma factor [Vitiosangium sp. GDMCC 1.1324]|uniref:RNA polymerase sigma factor n=1 Tax=Vitiosangium sp. (strain GDMCC 1.1324) TaxID=2138576 RepID=UPI00130EAC37|nr:sigma-70 family RNA polymerase sigma factor [Vitiosangium sp. GDMCC 1.1324]